MLPICRYGRLKRFPILIPSKEEQKCIVELFRGQHPCPVDDGAVGMVDNHVAVGSVLPAEEHEVDAELFFQLFLQFFLAAAHVPIFFKDAP